VDALAAIYALDGVKGFGPQKFKELHEAQIRPAEVIQDPDRLPIAGKRGEDFRAQLRNVSQFTETAYARAQRQIEAAAKHGAWILTYEDPRYPANVYASNNPVPVLYVRGGIEVLGHPKAVACVGSRKISPPYEELHSVFAQTAVQEGFTVVSGFALGADTVGHRAAWAAQGSTICCMPGGLDRPFPPENRGLWEELLCYGGAAFVSEFPFGTSASSLTLRKRNKLIVAFAQGVLISQSSVTGGAMNAFRFAVEQHKPVATFQDDGTEATSGNRQVDKPECQGTAFSVSSPDPERYRKWLSELSSST
jgi:DNA processing protein